MAGPKNLAKSAAAATSQVRAGTPSKKAPARPRVSTARASAGYGNPPGGAASGIAKATSPMASTPRDVTKPKSTKKGGINLRPRADGPSKI